MHLNLLNQIRAEVSGENALKTACDVAQFHRIQASPGFRAAAQMCANRLNAMGIDARIVSVPADGVQRVRTVRNFKEWDIQSGFCTISSPEPMRIADFDAAPLSVMPRSCACDFPEIEVVYMDRGVDASAYDGMELSGKLLFVHENFNAFMWAVGSCGAAGFITDYVTSPEDHHDVLRYTSFWWEETEEERKAFGFVLSPDRGRKLEAICLRARKNGERVLASCRIESKLYAGTLDYVEAFLPGETKEEIWITAHLCHPRTSANDNASGVGASIEAMRALHELTRRGELKLKRGVRLLLVPEMTGTLAHLHEMDGAWNHVRAGLNLDMVGAKQVDGYGPLILTQTPHSTPTIANAAAKLVMDLAKQEADYLLKGEKVPMFNGIMSPFTGGSDHYILSDPTVNIPTLMLGQWPDRYYHTSGDTCDVLSAHTLRISAQIACMYAALLSQTDVEDVKLMIGTLQELLMADIRKLDEDALVGKLPMEKMGIAYNMLQTYYDACMEDAVRWIGLSDIDASPFIEDRRFIGNICDLALERIERCTGALQRFTCCSGPILRRTYRMPIDSWTAVLDDEEKRAAMERWRNGPEKRLRDPHLVEILTQFYINGELPQEEVVNRVSIDCREPDTDAIRELIQLLKTVGLVEAG